MKQPSPYLLGLSLTTLTALAGCGQDAPAPSEVRARIATDLVHVLDEAEAATAGGDAMPGASALGLLDRTLGSALDGTATSGTGTALAAPLSRLDGLLAPRSDLRDRAGGLRAFVADEPTDTFDGEAAAQWLNDNLFTDANHAGDGVYRVPAALVCTETTYDETGVPTGEAVNPDCVDAYATFQLRIRVTDADDALQFALQIGPDHDEPLRVALAPTSLALTVDLDEAEDVIRSLTATLGGDELPAFSLTGEATATLAILGTAQAKLALDIDRAIAVKLADAGADLDGATALRFTSAAAHVVAVTLDGVAASSAFELGLGETRLHVPGDGVDLDLPGVSAAATFAAGQSLQVTDIGLGDRTTTLDLDGQRALAIDLNPDHGRRLAATISVDATGRETLEVSPVLDLRSQVDHAVLGDAPPVYDVTQVFLQGSLRSSELEPALEIATGTFRIATTPASYGITATAGQCATAIEAYDTASDRYYTQWSVAACP